MPELFSNYAIHKSQLLQMIAKKHAWLFYIFELSVNMMWVCYVTIGYMVSVYYHSDISLTSEQVCRLLPNLHSCITRTG